MKASVIIPTRNRGNALFKTLESVLNQTCPAEDYEVILVDSSTDDTPIIVQDFLAKHKGHPEIRFIREERVGLHYAKNKGVRASQGEVIAVIEDDAIADKNWLKELLAPFSDPEVACVGGKVLPIWEAEPPPWMEQFVEFLTVFDLGEEKKELPFERLVGCNIAARRDIIFRVGGYNPCLMGNVLLGDGEIGLQRKIIRKNAGKLIYTPYACVWHLIPPKRLTYDYMRWRVYNDGATAGQGLYQKKLPGTLGLLYYASSVAVIAFKHKLYSLIKLILKGSPNYFDRLWSLYYWRQVLYFLQLIYDRSFRKFVAREDWINEEK